MATKEDLCGISEYLTPDLSGFDGVLKERYSDFVVNEIDESGNVVHLTEDYKFNQEASVSTSVKPETGEPNASAGAEPEFDAAERSAFLEAYGQEVVAQIAAKKPVELDVSGMSKDDRRSLHHRIAKAFPSCQSTTKGGGDGKCVIEVKPTKQRGQNRGGQPRGPQRHLDFVLLKINRDSAEAARLLGLMFRRRGLNLTVAGTKDKRGITTQRVRIFGVRQTDLKLNMNGIHVGNFSYADTGLHLGELQGNRFGIVMRRVTETDAGQVTAGVEALRDRGFINFYGLQRFGSYGVPTWKVGRALLQEKYEEAVDLILAHSSNQIAKVTKDTNLDVWSPYDLVVPILGSGVELAENEVEAMYEEVLTKDGMSRSDFKHNVKEFNLTGDYRKVFVKPSNLTFDVIRYDDYTIPLLITDLDRIKDSSARQPEGVEDGTHLALRMTFDLPKSCYATMAIREVMRRSTAAPDEPRDAPSSRDIVDAQPLQCKSIGSKTSPEESTDDRRDVNESTDVLTAKDVLIDDGTIDRPVASEGLVASSRTLVDARAAVDAELTDALPKVDVPADLRVEDSDGNQIVNSKSLQIQPNRLELSRIDGQVDIKSTKN